MIQRGMNQVELSRASGVTQPQISGYLSGSPSGKVPSVGTLVKLARALHCDLEALTGNEELRGVVDTVIHVEGAQSEAYRAAVAAGYPTVESVRSEGRTVDYEDQ